jgi:hypothetical protein
MTNYLDPIANPDVVQVNTAGGDFLQLAVDMVYSLLLWGISFITDNFAIILVLVALGVIVAYGRSKLGTTQGRGAAVLK